MFENELLVIDFEAAEIAGHLTKPLRADFPDGWSRISGAPAISTPHTQRRARFQKRRRLPNQIQRFEKSRCQHDIGLRSQEQLGDVPIEEAQRRRAFAMYARVLQIAADSDLPRDVDEAVGGPEESARNVICAGRQALAQGEGFHDGDRHPLAVDRIEAAQGVAIHQKTLRKPVTA
jgi:hypothetical protein